MENNKSEITEREKKNKRREYMKKYYMKRKYNLGNGKTTRCKHKLDRTMITSLHKEKGDFVITFN